jgi:hypothetical protein
MASLYSRALTGYATRVSGVDVVVQQGEVRLDGDAVVAATPSLWEDVDAACARPGMRLVVGAIGGA